MGCFAIAFLLSGLVTADDKEDLGNAAKKFVEAKSYSFKGETTVTVPGRDGNTAPATPTAFEGKFAEDVGLVVQTAQEEIVKIGGKTAIRPKAVWRVIDEGGRGNRAPAMQAAFAGRGGAGSLSRSPQEELSGLDGKLDKATKSDKKETVGEAECTVFEAMFSSEGAKSLVPGGRAGAAGNAEVSASGRFWVSPDGHLVKYEITSKVSRNFNNRDFTTSTSRTATLFDVDKTKVELPAGAKEAIGQK